MYPIKEFEKRFRELLGELDDLKEELDDERMEEMNAQYEDALFVIECIDAEDEDWCEAFTDALEEFRDLCEEYRSMEEAKTAEAADRLEALVRLAEANLPKD